jgi:O-antigen/teichoic acid export membrane protein
MLGPIDFGKINFALAIVSYFILISNQGLNLFGIREVSRDRENVKKYIAAIGGLRLTLSFVSFVLLLMLTFSINKPQEIKILIILYGLGLFPTAIFFDWAFQGIEKMEYIGAARILNSVLYFVLVVLFVKSSNQLTLIPLLQIVGISLGAGLLILLFIKKFGFFRLSWNIKTYKNIIWNALPLGICMILIQVIYNIDTVMLGFMRSNTEVGHYNAAYKIILVLIAAGSIYFEAIFPVISNYYMTSLNSLRKLQEFTARISTIVALPLATGGTILARPIMILIYGSKYESGIIAFQILMWVVAMIYFNMVYAKGMWACNKEKEYIFIVTFQALLNIILNFFLIPPWGIVGAAISTLAAEFAGFFLYYREFNKIVSVPIHNYFLKPLLSIVIMTLFLQFLLLKTNMNIFLLIILGASIYFLSLYIMNGITRDDLINIRMLIRERKI